MYLLSLYLISLVDQIVTIEIRETKKGEKYE